MESLMKTLILKIVMFYCLTVGLFTPILTFSLCLSYVAHYELALWEHLTIWLTSGILFYLAGKAADLIIDIEYKTYKNSK